MIKSEQCDANIHYFFYYQRKTAFFIGKYKNPLHFCLSGLGEGDKIMNKKVLL